MLELVNKGMDFTLLCPAKDGFLRLEQRMKTLEEAVQMTEKKLKNILMLSPIHKGGEERSVNRTEVIREIKWGENLGVKYIICSNIHSGFDVLEYRRIIENTVKTSSEIILIAKVGNSESIKNINEILEQSDGILLDKQEMGQHFKTMQIPLIIKAVAFSCNESGKPVILQDEFNINEYKRIANMFIFDHLDGCSFSLNKGSGLRQEEVIHRFTGFLIAENRRSRKINESKRSELNSMSNVIHLVESSEAKAIVLQTKEGTSAEELLNLRLPIPIITITANKRLAYRFSLYRGSITLVSERSNSKEIIEEVKKVFPLMIGDRVVYIDDSVNDKGNHSFEIKVIGKELGYGYGIGGSILTGRVFIANGAFHENTMAFGDVLVIPNQETQVRAELIRKASLVITEEKSLNSFEAVVGLNLDKPMVLGAGGVSNIIHGEVVTVDTYSGIIYQGKS